MHPSSIACERWGQSNPNDLDLQVLAFHTGGLVLRKNNDLVAQIERCVSDAAGMYVFAYTPEKGSKPDIYHDLENQNPQRCPASSYADRFLR